MFFSLCLLFNFSVTMDWSYVSPCNLRSMQESSLGKRTPLNSATLKELQLHAPDEIVCRLLDKHGGLNPLLQCLHMDFETMNELMKVLAKAASSCTFKASSCDIFRQVFGLPFFNKLVDVNNELLESSTDVSEFFQNQLIVMERFLSVIPSTAMDKLPKLIKISLLVLCQLSLKFECMKVISEQYESFLVSVTSQMISRNLKHSGKNYLAKFDECEPEEDFRDLPITPTDEELTSHFKPFLRRNITDGSYADTHSYLDVQFRLMREDFIRYFRDGINELRRDPNSHPSNTFVYRNVTYLTSKFENKNVSHILQLDPSKRVNLKSRKKLMNGNLLCISADNFRTYSWATICFNSDKHLFQKRLAVELLSGDKLVYDVNYTVLESGAFFPAYKHVLAALQKFREEDIPFVEHIVFVTPEISSPAYLKSDSEYDLSAFQTTTLSKSKSVANDINVAEKPCLVRAANSLTNVTVSSELQHWPSALDLGLDESQLKAVHTALTKRIALIQGPPGTGKTFIGMKITEVLLKNKHIWKTGTERCPIVVICYTNHALDQFLEGILTFNENIIRIGSRCKNKEVEKYQIIRVLEKLEESKSIPYELFFKLRNENRLVKNLRDSYNSIQDFLAVIRERKGIVGLHYLYKKNIISQQVFQNLRGRFLRWILPRRRFEQTELNDFYIEKNNICKNVLEHTPFSSNWKSIKLLRERDRDDRFHDEFHEETSEEFTETCRFLRDVHYYQSRFKSAKSNISKKEVVAELRLFRKVVSFRSDHEGISHTSLQQDLFELSFDERCNLYSLWVRKLECHLSEELRKTELQLAKIIPDMEKSKAGKWLFAAKCADVVGLTTTGAANFQSILRDLKPKIGELP